jgi:O-antigen ligase
VSERIHLPWHIKNMAFNVLFDQGAVGLLLFVLLVGGTLWRLTAGHARRHPMAPFLTASLVGFLVVGAFDSLLDVPRVALAFYLVLFAGLALEEPPRETAAPLRVD